MKWSYVMFLPVVASLVWPLMMIIFKRKPTQAQVLFGVSMVMDAFAMAMLAILFRHRSGMMLVYDYLFALTALSASPLYYLAVCALTEPRGVSRKNRRVFIPPFVVIFCITVGFLWLGRVGYEELCQQNYLGDFHIRPGNWAYNFMLVSDTYLLYYVLILESLVLFFMDWHKMNQFSDRYNRFYKSTNLGNPSYYTRRMTVMAFLFMAMVAGMVFIEESRPEWAQPVIIVLSVMMAVVQLLRGYNAYNLNVDAIQLALLVRRDMQIEQSIAPAQAHRPAVTSRDICGYIEKVGYQDPDLSVADLAMRFRISVDSVVDLVYKRQGMPVSEYIDTVRVEHVTEMLMDSTAEDPMEDLSKVAYECGFLAVETLEEAFSKVMQVSVKQWLRNGRKK